MGEELSAEQGDGMGADVQTYKTPSEVVGKAYKGESGGPEVSLWGWDENYLLYSERERLDALGSVAYVRRNVNTLPLKERKPIR